MVVTYLNDTFTRTVASGTTTSWGTPDSGPTYDVESGGVSRASVNGSAGLVTIAGATQNCGIIVPITAVTDLRMHALVSLDKQPAGGRFSWRQVVRKLSTTDYHLRMYVETSGVMTMQFAKDDTAFIGSSVTLPWTFVADQKYHFVAQATSGSPTLLKAKAWKEGDLEPTTWDIETTDNTAGYQTTGSGRLYAATAAGFSNGPIVFAVDSLALNDASDTTVGLVKYMSVPQFGQTYLRVGAAFQSSVTAAKANLYNGATLVDTEDFTIDGTTKWGYAHFSSLTANTEYAVKVEIDEEEQTDRDLLLKTLPTGPSSYSFVAGSCQFTGSNHRVFEKIGEKGPRFIAHMGDLAYSDTEDRTTWRASIEASMGTARFMALTRIAPMNWSMDNHDRIQTNPAGGGTGLNLGETNPYTAADYKTYAGTTGWPSTETLGRTWVAGRVRFIQLDMWSVRDDGDGDPEPRTFLGSTQKQWFKDTLEAAEEPVIFWFCNWTGLNNANGRWNSFPTETTELETWINARPTIKARMILIGGDSHSLQADDGSRSGSSFRFAGIPSLNMSGFNRSGDAGDGNPNWSIANTAMRSSGETESNWGGYSHVTITDTGDSEIGVLWQARRVAVDGTEDVMATFNTTFDAPVVASYAPPVQGVTKMYSGAGDITRVYGGDDLIWDQSKDVFTSMFPLDETHTDSHVDAAERINDAETAVVELEKRSNIVIVDSLLDIPPGTPAGTTIIVR